MKRLLLFVAIALSMNLFAQVPTFVPTSGLEVYYSFSGNANEEISALNGVVNGATLSPDVNATPNSAYSFNGTSDYIAIPHEFLGGNDNITSCSYRVRFKVNAIDPVNQQGIWNKDGSWRENRIRIYPDSSINVSWYHPSTGTTHWFGTNPGTITPNIWYDIVFINSGPTPKTYVNGVEVGTITSSGFNPTVSFSHSGQACVGGGIECNRFGLVRWGGAPTRFLNGSIDEFGIWNRALNSCEINSMFNEANQVSSSVDIVSDCSSHLWIDGNTYTVSNNTATHTLTNAAGCDSVITLDLTINYPNTGTDIQTVCDSYTWIDGNTYTSDNNSVQWTLPNAAGCDSLVTLDLTITNSTSGTDVQTACDTYTWIDGNTYTASNNTATYTTMNAAGCDSVVTLDLTINNFSSSTDIIIACDSYTWVDGNTYTASNNSATYTTTNVAGCDSVVTLDLTINYSNTGTDVITACDSYTWVDGNTYTASNNTATYTTTNAAGCDSVVALDLTINPNPDNSVTQNGAKLTANQEGGTYEW
ncbi:MAG: LamG domain-containing protein, partial [Crocinitomicaceae bacterium]|nr:LamG domain-containing protein [Crocinitomicaceae bacterium]